MLTTEATLQFERCIMSARLGCGPKSNDGLNFLCLRLRPSDFDGATFGKRARSFTGRSMIEGLSQTQNALAKALAALCVLSFVLLSSDPAVISLSFQTRICCTLRVAVGKGETNTRRLPCGAPPPLPAAGGAAASRPRVVCAARPHTPPASYSTF